MSENFNKIILLRHAESIKNIKKIHGKCSEKLTEVGVQQAKNVAKYLHTFLNISTLKIFTMDSNYTKETAEILSRFFKIKINYSIDFAPINLGLADGLSDDELLLRYPETYKLFGKWRRREIDIKELKVPGIEPYMTFWERGKDFIDKLPNDGDIVLVCSNSLIILLTNILLNNHPQLTDNYKHISIPNCGVIVFKTRDFRSFDIDNKLTTVDILQ